VPKRTAHSVSAVVRAAAVSASTHLLILGFLGRLAGEGPTVRAVPPTDYTLLLPGWADAEEIAAELLPEEAFDLSKALPLPPERPPMPEGDLSTLDPRPRGSHPGEKDEHRARASDDGEGPGRPAEIAWRRDTTNLRSRPSDGALFYQTEKERSAREASSPQASRQERRTGTGDSARTKRPRTELRPPDPILPIERPDEEDEEPPLPVEEPPLAVAALGPGGDTIRAEGALSAERGQKAFDAPRPGPAHEQTDVRSASNELHPGLTDFSAPSAVRGPSRVGQGPGDAPGIVKIAQAGIAVAVAGARAPAPIGAIGEGSDERVYAREHLEIRQRVARALRFPRRLAIMLEQGEAIILFQVERDGRVHGEVKLEKSAGFEEFDKEAIDVVRRAAPFPVLPKKLLVRMRIPFENPMIQ
jgi:periplasmic protein TonB